jgi:hypothetical protein
MVGILHTGSAVTLDAKYVEPHTHERFKRENPSLIGFDNYKDRVVEAAE